MFKSCTSTAHNSFWRFLNVDCEPGRHCSYCSYVLTHFILWTTKKASPTPLSCPARRWTPQNSKDTAGTWYFQDSSSASDPGSSVSSTMTGRANYRQNWSVATSQGIFEYNQIPTLLRIYLQIWLLRNGNSTINRRHCLNREAQALLDFSSFPEMCALFK